MKRRNAECGKLRRPLKRNKITEGIYGSTILYLKFLILWALVLLADFILEFRFEFLWPFWLLLRSVYDSFKYQGLAFSVFFICIALTSDMICFFFIPVHWLFFAASTYVWVQYVWHTERGVCLPTVILWLLFVYIEAAVRLRDLRHMPFHLDLCRPFAAHCIGYPVVTLGFGFKSYIGYRMRQRKQKDVAKENEFYMQLLQQALPLEQQAQSHPQSPCHSTSPDKSRGTGVSVTAEGATTTMANGSANPSSNATKNSHRKSLDKGEVFSDVDASPAPAPALTPASPAAAAAPAMAAKTDKADKVDKTQHNHRYTNGSVPAEFEFIERVGRKVQDALLAVVVKPRGGGGSGGAGSGGAGTATVNGRPVGASSPTSTPTNTSVAAASQRRQHTSINDFDSNEVEKVDKSAKGSVCASLAQSSRANGAPGGKWAHHNHHHHHHNANHSANHSPATTQHSVTHQQQSKGGGGGDGHAPNSSGAAVNNNSGGSSKAKGKANREPQPEMQHKNEYALRLESDVKRLKADLQGSRQAEQELRAQVAVLSAGERNQRSELSQLHQDNDELQSKLHGLVSARAADKQSLSALERRLAEERRARAGAEAALAAERKAKRAEEAAAARALALAHHHHQQQQQQQQQQLQQQQLQQQQLQQQQQQQQAKQECSEACRARRRELEAEGKALRRELKLQEERVLAHEREIQNLRQYKDNHNDAEILMSALSAMQDKNAHLENSLSAETRIKLDLFSALGEAKRQLEIKECIIRAQDKELDELKAKMAQVLAVMPSEAAAFAPVTQPSPLQASKLRLAPLSLAQPLAQALAPAALSQPPPQTPQPPPPALSPAHRLLPCHVPRPQGVPPLGVGEAATSSTSAAVTMAGVAASSGAAATACALQQGVCPSCPSCTASTLDPNATAYTPKGGLGGLGGAGLVASTEA